MESGIQPPQKLTEKENSFVTNTTNQELSEKDFALKPGLVEENNYSEDCSLMKELGLQNTIQAIAQENGRIVYAHTMYYELNDIDLEGYLTETEEPVENIFFEKQQRILIDALQNDKVNWTDRNFMTASNVGIYYDPNIKSPIVPDIFLSFDVPDLEQWFEKKLKAYFTWIVGKPPELVLEIVSNRVGGEDTTKLEIYAKIGVKYYIIQDPYCYLSEHKIRLFILNEKREYEEYIPVNEADFYYMPEVNLGLVLWRGLYEDIEAEWMRWCNKSGRMLLTGKERIAQEVAEKERERERAEQEKQRAEQEKQRAEQEKQRAEQKRLEKEKEREHAEQEKQRAEQERLEKEKERERAEKLLAKLLSLGIRPEEL